MSMNTSTTNSVGASLLKMRPKYYSSSLPPALLPLLPAINTALLSSGTVNSPPLAITVPIYSLGIGSPPRLFTSFAKTASWGQDIWADFVAPTLNSSLFMEGWVNGNVNGTLGSDCGAFPVNASTMRVSSVTFNSFYPITTRPQNWPSTKDHRHCPIPPLTLAACTTSHARVQQMGCLCLFLCPRRLRRRHEPPKLSSAPSLALFLHVFVTGACSLVAAAAPSAFGTTPCSRCSRRQSQVSSPAVATPRVLCVQ